MTILFDQAYQHGNGKGTGVGGIRKAVRIVKPWLSKCLNEKINMFARKQVQKNKRNTKMKSVKKNSKKSLKNINKKRSKKNKSKTNKSKNSKNPSKKKNKSKSSKKPTKKIKDYLD